MTRSRSAPTHVALEYICWYLGQGEAAVQHAAQAVAILEPHGPTVELGRALAGAGTFEVDRGDPHQAIGTLRRAIEIAHLVGDPYAESNALNSIGWAEDYYGDVDTGVTYLEQALEWRSRTASATSADGLTRTSHPFSWTTTGSIAPTPSSRKGCAMPKTTT